MHEIEHRGSTAFVGLQQEQIAARQFGQRRFGRRAAVPASTTCTLRSTA
jgi:hypothetical protein